MRIEALCTGDELLTGVTTDTNSTWFQQRLLEHGLQVNRTTVVGDVRAEILEALQTLSARSDVVLVSGGLGPTTDDLTAEVAARAAGVPLVVHEGALAALKERFAVRAATSAVRSSVVGPRPPETSTTSARAESVCSASRISSRTSPTTVVRATCEPCSRSFCWNQVLFVSVVTPVSSSSPVQSASIRMPGERAYRKSCSSTSSSSSRTPSAGAGSPASRRSDRWRPSNSPDSTNPRSR